MLFDPALNGFEQILFFHGLGQELKRSALHCANRHWNISMASDKNYGQINLGFGELLLKIQATQAWQTNIEHQTTGNLWSSGAQKVPCRCKCLNFNSDRPNEPFQGSADGGIVVDHDNDFLRRSHVFVPSSRPQRKLE